PSLHDALPIYLFVVFTSFGSFSSVIFTIFNAASSQVNFSKFIIPVAEAIEWSTTYCPNRRKNIYALIPIYFFVFIAISGWSFSNHIILLKGYMAWIGVPVFR